jgi:hypothetical protein
MVSLQRTFARHSTGESGTLVGSFTFVAAAKLVCSGAKNARSFVDASPISRVPFFILISTTNLTYSQS